VHIALPDDKPFALPVSVQLTNNTMIVTGLAVNLQTTFPVVPAQTLANPKVRIEADENICTAGLVGCIYFAPTKEVEDVVERDHRLLARRLFSVEERGNHLTTGPRFAAFSIVPTSGKGRPLGEITTAAEWKEFWKLGATNSVAGKIAFRRPLSPSEPNPERLTPQDFRIDPDAPGGKARGAAVDLVGPGTAYETWKKTPAYQEWLKDSGQAK
jgi:hypothetical protein